MRNTALKRTALALLSMACLSSFTASAEGDKDFEVLTQYANLLGLNAGCKSIGDDRSALIEQYLASKLELMQLVLDGPMLTAAQKPRFQEVMAKTRAKAYDPAALAALQADVLKQSAPELKKACDSIPTFVTQESARDAAVRSLQAALPKQ